MRRHLPLSYFALVCAFAFGCSPDGDGDDSSTADTGVDTAVLADFSTADDPTNTATSAIHDWIAAGAPR